jgi:hypothetical protein
VDGVIVKRKRMKIIIDFDPKIRINNLKRFPGGRDAFTNSFAERSGFHSVDLVHAPCCLGAVVNILVAESAPQARDKI